MMQRLGILCLGAALFCGSVVIAEPRVCCAASYHVDSAHGDDANPGTETEPWKTIAKANSLVPSLKPGDALLFRRGSKWEGESLKINGIRGTEAHPITVGAYGPQDEPRPSIKNGRIGVFETEHLIIRAMEVHHNPSGPCIAVSNSGYITTIDNWVHHSKSNGIAYHAFVHHTVTVDNIVHDVLSNDGISIHDSGRWGKKPGPVGSHHWVIDNFLPGKYHEDAIDVASEDKENGPAAQDIKIIGNRVFGARLCGIVSQHQCRYTWVLGNTLVGCGHGGAKALSLGKEGENGDGWVKASGNVLFENPRGVRLRDQVDFQNNTIIHSGGSPILLLNRNADNMILQRNLFLSAGASFVLAQDEMASIRQIVMDRNWYGPIQAGQATLKLPFRYQGKHTFASWQKQFRQDQNSEFGPVSGLQLDSGTTTDVKKWDQAFLARFIPDKTWKGHQRDGGVGAFAAEGKRLGMEITPFPKLELNGGYGWAGTKLVQQRYPLP